jgi:hypothetical protein
MILMIQMEHTKEFRFYPAEGSYGNHKEKRSPK